LQALSEARKKERRLEMSKRLGIALVVACTWAMATDSHAALRKQLAVEQMVNLSDVIVQGEIIESAPFSKGIVAATLRVDKVIYGGDTLAPLTVLGNPEIPASSREQIVGRVFKIGENGIFFLRHVPRGLSREFDALSKLQWSVEEFHNDVTVVAPSEFDPKRDRFFVPFSEMYWPLGQDGVGTTPEESAVRIRSLLTLVEKRLKEDIERFSRAEKSAKERLAAIQEERKPNEASKTR
jgi:hypothetical protein